jgi:hypothetical protein
MVSDTLVFYIFIFYLRYMILFESVRMRNSFLLL